MRKGTYYFYLLLSLFFSNIQAQNQKKLDSLLLVLNQDISEKEKVDTYNNIAIHYYRYFKNDTVNVLLYTNKARKFSEEIEYPVGIATAYNIIGSYKQYKHDYLGAIEAYNELLDISKKHDFKIRVATALYGLGNCYDFKEDYSKGSEYYYQALSVYKDLGNKTKIADVYNSLGVINLKQGINVVALKYFQNALIIEKELGRKIYIGQAYSNIGNVHLKQKELDKAYKNTLQALEKYTETNFKYGIAASYTNLGIIESKRENHAEAHKHYKQALKLNLEINRKKSIALNYINFADLFLAQNKIDSVPFYANKALSLATEINYKRVIANANIQLGKYYRLKSRNTKAIPYIKYGIDIAEEIGLVDEAKAGSENLYQVYKAKGNYELSLKAYEQYVRLKDSTFNKETTEKLTRLEAEYEYGQKAIKDSIQSVTLLNAQKAVTEKKQTTSNFLLAGLLLTLIFSFLIWNRFQVTRKQKAQLCTAYSDLNEANLGLKELDKLKSRFFTNISHEFRTPLTVISGLTDKIKDVRAKRLVKNNSDHLLLLINQILDLRKLESGNLAINYIQANIVEYLNYLCESFQSLATDKEIGLEFESDTKELMVDYDAEKILRIVSNLITNAVKFTGRHGRVVLSLRKYENIYQIQVTDTGIGISEDKISYLFDRFYQIDESITRDGEGTGIGLTLVKELVELMKGSIEVKSKIGEGTTFTVTLPVTNKAKQEDYLQFEAPTNLVEDNEVTLNQTTEPEKKEELPNLLLVEDNKDVMEYLSICLKDSYNLSFAFNGQEGIDLAIKDVPDIIISDVMMPHRDGFDLCNTLKQDERTSHIPIILLTAKADIDSRIQGLKRGADAYLDKPFDKRELDIQLQNLLKIRNQLQERYSSFKELEPTINVIEQQEDVFITKIKQLILDHMTEDDFGVVELCRKAAMSRTQLHNKIKSLTNKSTSQFIKQLRINKAKELFLKTNLNVSEVALKVGIDSLPYFSRLFTEETGKTPNKFRNPID